MDFLWILSIFSEMREKSMLIVCVAILATSFCKKILRKPNFKSSSQKLNSFESKPSTDFYFIIKKRFCQYAEIFEIHTSLFFEIMLKYLHTGIAQLVEHRSPKPGVGSSSLFARAIL